MNTQLNIDKGIFWICSDKFYEEAIKSAQQVAEIMPDYPRVLFIENLEIENDLFDGGVVNMPSPTNEEFWFLRSTFYFGLALSFFNDNAKLIYLDVDTYMYEAIDDLYWALDHFDFIASHAPGRRTAATVKHIPQCFPEINIGVLAFKNNEVIKSLFADWWVRYSENKEVYGNNDQAPLREALWENDTIRYYIMPPEYNCRYQFGGFARWAIKVLHGRSEQIVETAQKINEKKVMRGWDRGTYQ